MSIARYAILALLALLFLMALLSFRDRGPESNEPPICRRGEHPETHGCQYF